MTRAVLLAVLVAACYAPDLPECVVACAGPADCAPDQTCGGDRLCASPELAGRCDELDQPDARVARPDAGDDPPDARPDARVDAEPPPDASLTSTLRVVIDGKGKVKVSPPIDHECKSDFPTGTTCNYPAPSGESIELEAKNHQMWIWAAWTGCSPSSAPTCVVTVGPGTTIVTATFVPE